MGINILKSIDKAKVNVVDKLKILKTTFPKSKVSDREQKGLQTTMFNVYNNDKLGRDKDNILANLYKELEYLKIERKEIMSERFELTQSYCDDKRELELYPVTGPISKMKAKIYSEQLEEDEEDLKWYSDSLREFDDVIAEIEEKMKLLKSEK